MERLEKELKLKAIFDHFKADTQFSKLREEIREFEDAFEAYFLYDDTLDNWTHLVEEFVDVSVLISQFMLTLQRHAINEKLDFETLFKIKTEEKIDRTIERIESGYYDDEH